MSENLKIKIAKAGSAIVITIPLAMEELKEYEKVTPLNLFNPETKEPVFVMATGRPGTGTISSHGVIFDTTDKDGFAQLTIHTAEPVDTKEFAKKYCEAFKLLEMLLDNAMVNMTKWVEDVNTLEAEITVLA